MTAKPLVCVTGATGFIASCLVSALVQRGYRVRGTVRDVRRGAPYLQKLNFGYEDLELVEADLLNRESFVEAVKGCHGVFHTASPYVLESASVMADIVEPAVKGTLNVLAACKADDEVGRVVLTSSMAAITDEPENGRVLTEEDWNVKSSPTRNPYYYSKAEAERAAWRFMEDEFTSFDLVALNPYMVIGPSLMPSLNPTNKIFVDLLNGTYPGIMNLSWGLVDVRDVAEAHILAMEQKNAKGRYILANPPVTMGEVVGWMREAGYGIGTKLPTRQISDFMVRLGSHLQSKGVGNYLRTHIGRTPSYDTAKARDQLGVSLRPPKELVLDTLQDLAQWRHIDAVKKPPARSAD